MIIRDEDGPGGGDTPSGPITTPQPPAKPLGEVALTTLPTPPDTPARDPATPDLHEWAEDAARALDRAGLLRNPRRFWPVLACHLITSAVVAVLVFGLAATGHDAFETAAYTWPLVFAAQAVGELVALWPGRTR